MPLELSVVIERQGIELFRHPYRHRQPGGVSPVLAEAYDRFRRKVSDDGIPDDELNIRFDRRQVND